MQRRDDIERHKRFAQARMDNALHTVPLHPDAVKASHGEIDPRFDPSSPAFDYRIAGELYPYQILAGSHTMPDGTHIEKGGTVYLTKAQAASHPNKFQLAIADRDEYEGYDPLESVARDRGATTEHQRIENQTIDNPQNIERTDRPSRPGERSNDATASQPVTANQPGSVNRPALDPNKVEQSSGKVAADAQHGVQANDQNNRTAEQRASDEKRADEKRADEKAAQQRSNNPKVVS